MKISKLGGVAALGLGLALVTAAPAAAHHNEVAADISTEGCTLSASSSWASDEHVVESAAVVVLVGGEVHAAAVGDPLEVALPAGTTAVNWRVWGGGERDYDQPALTDLDALVAHLEAGGGELDPDAPGVAWNELAVEGCEPESSPSPTSTPSPTGDPGCDLVDQLEVADEVRDGYDRSLFGDYDRQALLDASLAEYGDYYSLWDDTHYDDAGEVDVDHLVALAEAWDSGAHSWGADQLDEFGGDLSNLTLLTDDVNQGAKSDHDPTGWVPPVASLVDDYVLAYVAVKAEYGLTVDEAERDRLLELAVEHGLCDAAGGGDSDGEGGSLPQTGVALPALVGGGVAVVAVGGGLFWLARRRRVSFTA